MVEKAIINEERLNDLANSLSKEVAEFNIYIPAEKIIELVQSDEISLQELEEDGAVPVLEYFGAGVGMEEEYEYVEW